MRKRRKADNSRRKFSLKSDGIRVFGDLSEVTYVEVDGAPPQVSACVTSRLALLKTYQGDITQWHDYDSREAFSKIATGDLTEDERTEWDRFGVDMIQALDNLYAEADSFGYGHTLDLCNPPDHVISLHCGHNLCGQHAVEGVGTPSGIPSLPTTSSSLSHS